MARSLRGRDRLARISAPLRPDQPPYHVNAPRRGHPSPGWYWQPAGVAYPTYLGFNHIQAELALLVALQAAGLADPEPWMNRALL